MAPELCVRTGLDENEALCCRSPRAEPSIERATKKPPVAPLLNLVYSTSVEKEENNGSVECCAPAMREIGAPRPDKTDVIPRAYCDICKKKRHNEKSLRYFGCCGSVQVSLHRPDLDFASFGNTIHSLGE